MGQRKVNGGEGGFDGGSEQYSGSWTQGAVHATAVYKITEELGHARVRIDALAHENQALRAKLAAGPADVPRGAGMATFMMSTSPERENADLGAYGFGEVPVEIPMVKAKPVKTLKSKRDALGGDPPPLPSSSSSSTSSSCWGRGRSERRRADGGTRERAR